MNIFLDKSLPRKKQIALTVIRVLFFITFFGGIFFFGNNELFGDILIYTGVFLAIVYTVFKIIAERKKKRLEKSITLDRINES